MNTLQIQECLNSINPLLQKNVSPANRLLLHIEAPTFLVSNLDYDTQPGSNWVVIHVDKNKIGQYFDSFGRAPKGFHKAFLNRNCKIWYFNIKKIQNEWTSVYGEFCLVYLHLMFYGQSMQNFVRIFDEDDDPV